MLVEIGHTRLTSLAVLSELFWYIPHVPRCCKEQNVIYIFRRFRSTADTMNVIGQLTLENF